MKLTVTNASEISQAFSGLIEKAAVYTASVTRQVRYSTVALEQAFSEWGAVESRTLTNEDFDSFREIEFLGNTDWQAVHAWVGSVEIDTSVGKKYAVFQTFYRDPFAVRTALIQLDSKPYVGVEQLLSADEIGVLFTGITRGGPDQDAIDLFFPRGGHDAEPLAAPSDEEDDATFGPTNIPRSVRAQLDEIVDALIHNDFDRIEHFRRKDYDQKIIDSGRTIDHGYRDFISRLRRQFVPLPTNCIDEDHVGRDLNDLSLGESTWMDVDLYTVDGSPSELVMSTTVSRLTETDYRVEVKNLGL